MDPALMTRLFAILALLLQLCIDLAAGQVGRLGNGIPTGTVFTPPIATAPTDLGSFTPPNGAEDIATDTTVSCSATGATSYGLVIGTSNPPVSGVGDAQTFTGSSCSFSPTMVAATTYYEIFTASNANGSTTSAVQTFGTLSAPVEFFTFYSWGTTGWSTFGLTLDEGIATGGVQVGAFTTQTDVKVTHADGSIKFAVVTVDITAAGTYGIKDSTASVGTFTPTVPTATAVFTVSGNTHTATMPSSLGTDCWLDGPLVKECRNIVTPDNSPTVPFANVRVYFDTRVYNDGESRVDYTVDNTKNLSTAQYVVYDASLVVNGSTVYSKSANVTTQATTITDPVGNFTATTSAAHGLTSADVGKYVRLTGGTFNTQFRRIKAVPTTTTLTLEWYFPSPGVTTPVTWDLVEFIHPLHTRWRKTFAANGYIEAEITPDMQLLYDSKATMGPYLSTITSANFTSQQGGYFPFGVGYRYDILSPGGWEQYEPAPGGREELGFRPMVAAQYLTFKTQAFRQRVLWYGDSAGARRKHFTNTSNRMITTTDLPTFSAGNATCCGNGVTGPAGGGPSPDVSNGYWGEVQCAHQPSIAFLPYVLTGDRYYADEMKFWAEWCTISVGTSGRVAGTNALHMPTNSTANIQVRAVGWTVRELTDTAGWLPDADPDKAHFVTLLQANLDNIETYSTTMASTDDPTLQSRPFIQRTSLPGFFQGWMQVYMALGLHHAARNGFTATGGGTDARDKIVDYWVARMQNAAAWPIEDCCPYYLYWKRSATGGDGTTFSTLADQYSYNDTLPVPAAGCCSIATTPFFPTQGGSTNNPRYGEHRLIGLIALDAGRPNALAAYTTMETLMSTLRMTTKFTWRYNQLESMDAAVGPAFAFDRID